MKTILVAGANGKTGREIIDLLKSTPSFKPVAMIRNPEQEATFDLMDVETVVADLEGDLTEAVKGADAVIFAAGSGSQTPPQKTIDVDQNGAINLIDKAKAAGVKKFIMLSAMGADNPDAGPNGLAHYLKAKRTADDYLKAAFTNYTIIRPGHLTDGVKTNKIKAAQKIGEIGKISRKDVAQVLVDSLTDGNTKNKTFEILEGNMESPIALSSL